MRSRSQIVSLILLLAFTAYCSAADQRHYLRETAVDAVKLLPAPPPANCDEARAELDLLVAVQQTRTPEQVARCQAEEDLGLAAFRGVVGPWLTAESLPKLDGLLKNALGDGKYITDAAKTHYARKRPFAEDNRIVPAVRKETSPAYPSGHATRGAMMAAILAKLDPEHREAILERGRQVGWDRVIGGVHRPSDIMGGRVLGRAIAHALFDSPAFQKDFGEVQAEFDQARKQRAEPAGTGGR